MKFNNKKLCLAAMSAVVLMGCNSSDDDTDHTYTVNCDSYAGVQPFEGTMLTQTCAVYDNLGTDLSATTYRFNTGEEQSGTVTNYKLQDSTAEMKLIIPAGSGGVNPELCITPRALATNISPGNEQCFITNDPIQSYVKPVATVDDLTSVYTQVTYQPTYTVSDENERELEVAFSWKADGTEVATTHSYRVDQSLLGANIEFCVTPTATSGANAGGDPACTTPVTVESDPTIDVPVASDVVFTISGGKTDVEVDDVLSGTYTYTSAEAEAATSLEWFADDMQVLTCPAVGVACDYTVTQDDVGKAMQFRVKPVNASSIQGLTVVSDPLMTFGIKVSGSMEFLHTLNAEVYGYYDDIASVPTTDIKWYLDMSVDLAGDRVRAAVGHPAGAAAPIAANVLASPSDIYTVEAESFEIAPLQNDLLSSLQGQADGTVWINKFLQKFIAFTSGARKPKVGSSSAGDLEKTFVGGVSDFAWFSIVGGYDFDNEVASRSNYVDAKNLIGKEIKLCIDNLGSGSKTICLNASESSSVTDALLWEADTKGVAPVKTLDFAGGISHHRPLTVAEVMANASLPNSTAGYTVGGISWAGFKQAVDGSGEYDDTQTAVSVDFCQALTANGATWQLPVSGVSGADVNVYSGKGNVGITGSDYEGMVSLGAKFMTLRDATVVSVLSRGTGWPLAADTTSAGSGNKIIQTPVFTYGSADTTFDAFIAGVTGTRYDATNPAYTLFAHSKTKAGTTPATFTNPVVSCVSQQ